MIYDSILPLLCFRCFYSGDSGGTYVSVLEATFIWGESWLLRELKVRWESRFSSFFSSSWCRLRVGGCYLGLNVCPIAAAFIRSKLVSWATEAFFR